MRWVLASAPRAAGWVHVGLKALTVDSRIGAVENLIGENRILKIKMFLGNVLPHDSSKQQIVVKSVFRLWSFK